MIADKIKNARTIKKLTQEQVAEDLNVSRQTILRIQEVRKSMQKCCHTRFVFRHIAWRKQRQR